MSRISRNSLSIRTAAITLDFCFFCCAIGYTCASVRDEGVQVLMMHGPFSRHDKSETYRQFETRTKALQYPSCSPGPSLGELDTLDNF